MLTPGFRSVVRLGSQNSDAEFSKPRSLDRRANLGESVASVFDCPDGVVSRSFTVGGAWDARSPSRTYGFTGRYASVNRSGGRRDGSWRTRRTGAAAL